MKNALRIALFLITSMIGMGAYASCDDAEQKTVVTRSSIEIGSSGIQFNITQGDQDFFDIQKILLGHISKKLRTSEGKELLGLGLCLVNMLNLYGNARLYGNTNSCLKYLFLMFSIGSFFGIVDSFNFAFSGKNENIMALISEYEETGYVDSTTLRKVSLLFTRMKRDLELLAASDSSSQLVKSIYGMANEISIDDIEDSKEFEKVLNFFDYCQTVLQKNCCCSELENNNGKDLLRSTLFLTGMFLLFDVLKWQNII